MGTGWFLLLFQLACCNFTHNLFPKPPSVTKHKIECYEPLQAFLDVLYCTVLYCMCFCTASRRRTWKTSLWMERATESSYLQELRWYIINSFQLLVVLFFERSFQRQVPQLTTARFSNSTNATSMASSWCDENITNITHNTIYLFPKPSVIKKQNKIKCYEPFESSLVCVSNRTQFVNERNECGGRW